jgi:hypothetical protein
MKLSKLLYKESRWTKGCLGRTKDGTPINSLDIRHRDGHEYDPSREIESYSLYGAIIHLFEGDGRQEVILKVGNAVRQYSGRKIWLAQWNDDPMTSFEDVKAVLEIANL